MADNELDKSIEELEAEVLAELELDEANGQDAPKKGAVPAEKMDKAKGEVQDTGKAVVDPEQKDAPAKKVAAKAKEVGGQSPQKGEGNPTKCKNLLPSMKVIQTKKSENFVIPKIMTVQQS